MTQKKLYRSRTDRMIAGVAGGIAEYFAIDPVIVRLLFVLLAIAGGPGVVVYIIAWIVIPEAPMPDDASKEKGEETVASRAPRAKAKDIGEEIESKAKDMARDVQESAARISHSPDRTNMVGLIILALGIIFLIQNITGFDVWGNLWPLIIIAVGLGLILRGTQKESA